jgi:toxin ParE1/3/4
MSSFSFTSAAEEDLLEILNYIALQRPVTARKWFDTLREKCAFLSIQPELGQLRPEFGSNCRSFSVNRWVIYYQATTDEIVILRVLDGARDVESLLG